MIQRLHHAYFMFHSTQQKMMLSEVSEEMMDHSDYL